MPTFNDNLTAIRLLLDRPDPQRPGLDILFQHLTDQVQHHHNQLQNSSAQWSVASILLTTSGGNEDYLLSADNFGKPFFVYTTDDSNESYVRREIPFVMLQNIDQFYSGVQQTQITDQHTVQYISFYRSAGSWYARVTPIPSGSRAYTIFYETADIPAPALGSIEGISCFNHLIRVQTALAALPHCGWGEIHPLAKGEAGLIWARRIESLAKALAPNEAKYQKEFSTYIGTLMQAGVESRDPFGDGGDLYWFNNSVSW